MSDLYYDAIVTTLMDALGCRMGTYADDPVCWTHDVIQFDGTARCPQAIEALDVTTPAIAAKTLRAFATRMESSEWTHRDDWGVKCAYALEVSNRADEIERGAS